MNAADDPRDSFDPRTWAEPGSRPEGAQTASGRAAPLSADSFDPRSWTQQEAHPVAPQSAAGINREPTLRTSLSAAPRQRKAAALFAGAAILLAGAGAAYLSRGNSKEAVPQQEAARPVAVEAESQADPAAGGGSRTIMLADASQIKPTLLISGISESEANSATSQVVSLLGTGDGELRLAFTLTGTGKNTALAKLEATRTNGSGVLLTRTSGGAFSPQPLAPQLTVRTYAKRGELDDTSFYTSAVAAGITDSLISDFANAFSFDFDFQREVKPGAVFEGVFEQAANPAGAAVGEPRLIYVSLSTPGKARRFYRFTPPGEKEPGWFDDNGRSTVRSLMRTPLDGARVTSKFGLRIHPIYGSAKMHGGIDFGAPTGTPIYASGNGVVEVASMRGGAGNMVRVNHDNGWSTHYFHLHRFAPGLLVGQRVAQGQTIGEVGSTGASTGPHLHYELLVEGKKVDPLSVDTGTGVTLQGATLATFRKERDRIDLTRAQQSE